MWGSEDTAAKDDPWGSSSSDPWGTSSGTNTDNQANTESSDAGWGSSNASSSNNNQTNTGWGSSGGGGNSSGQKGCFNCGESGHMSRECPKPRKQGGGGGGGGGSTCYNCGESGHMSRDCPKPRKQGGGGGGGGSTCYNCGESGHMSRDCPKPRKQGGGGGGRSCFNCGESGHMSRDCSKPKKQSSGSGSGGGGWGSSNTNNDSGGWGSSGAATNSDSGGWGSSNAPSNNDNSGWGSSDTGATKDTGGWGSSTTATDNSGWGGGESTSCNTDGKSGWGNSDSGDRGQKRSGDSDSFNKRPKREDQQNGEAAERPAPFKPDELNLEEEAQLQKNGTGENFQKYNEQKVTCAPIDLNILPVEEFEDIVKSTLLLDNIKKRGYKEMTPIQKWAMPIIMQGYDLIGCSQTGSGKTAAFLLPVLQTLISSDLESHDPNSDCVNPYCLIISPTRELANQTYVHCSMLSRDSIIKSQVIYGQISTAHLKANLMKGCHILVATPGRLKDFVGKGWIGFKNIKFIILDEGDRLVDEGFTADIKGLFENETMPPKEKRQTLLFSATFKVENQLNAKEYLSSPVFLTVGRVGSASGNIKQEFLQVSKQEKKRELKKILMEIPETAKAIIFTQTKNGADMLAGFFTALNLSSTSIHGDRHQSQRDQAIKSFKRGEKRFLISSPVGNRGLDLPEVGLVINYDLPSNIDEYVHRIGRTGRAGHTGRAISFYDADRDQELLPSLLITLKEAEQEIPDWIEGTSGDQNNDTEQTSTTPAEDWGTNDESSTAQPAASDDMW